jgi:hypothetical protein
MAIGASRAVVGDDNVAFPDGPLVRLESVIRACLLARGIERPIRTYATESADVCRSNDLPILAIAREGEQSLPTTRRPFEPKSPFSCADTCVEKSAIPMAPRVLVVAEPAVTRLHERPLHGRLSHVVVAL